MAKIVGGGGKKKAPVKKPIRVAGPLSMGLVNPRLATYRAGPMVGRGPSMATPIPYEPRAGDRPMYTWPTLPTAPATPDIGTEGYSPFALPSEAGPADVHWQVGSYGVPGGNVPSWWRPFVPTDMSIIESRPDVSFTMMLNTMIPYLSPEDQVRAATQLYGMWDTELSQYKPAQTPPGGAPGTGVPYPYPGPITQEQANRMGSNLGGAQVINPSYYMSPERADQLIGALSNMREATVGGERTKLGPGYRWLQEVAAAVANYGGGRSPTQRVGMLGALDPLLSQAQTGELGPYAALGQMFTNPFMSRGQMWDTAANPLLMY